MYKINFFVPVNALEKVKNALFDAGAGQWGKYDRCSWEAAGTGQFRPLEGSRPAVGSPGKVERIEEFKVEMICRDDKIKAVLKKLLEVHPYEEPAYDIIRTEEISLILGNG